MRSIAIRVEDELFRRFKIHVAKKDMTLQDYLCDLIQREINPITEEETEYRIKQLQSEIEMLNNKFDETIIDQDKNEDEGFSMQMM